MQKGFNNLYVEKWDQMVGGGDGRVTIIGVVTLYRTELACISITILGLLNIQLMAATHKHHSKQFPLHMLVE